MKDCLECVIASCVQSGKDVLPLLTCPVPDDRIVETCPNCDGCKKLDFYYCANCGRVLRTLPIGG